MDKVLRAFFTLGLMLIPGLAKLCEGANPDPVQAKPIVSIHAFNYAEVSSKTLIEAEKIAAGVFRKAGVDTRWLDWHEKKKFSDEPEEFERNHIALHILPRAMTQIFGLGTERMGFVPGQGPHRRDVYIFYDRAEQFARQQAEMQAMKALVGMAEPIPTITQVLGHVIAHELGHVLGLETHSATGIMRADWSSADLQHAIFGHLTFTSQQAEVIRAEGSRRTRQQEAPQYDGTALKLRAGQRAQETRN
jgi:hypothetical protein